MPKCLLFVWPFLFPADAALVGRLGSEDFARREAAHAELASRGWGARTALLWGRGHEDPEVRWRCEWLYQSAQDKVLDGLRPLPMIDALYFDCSLPTPGYRKAFCPAGYEYASRYLAVTGKDGYPYRRYYEAADMACRDLLEEGVPPWVIGAVLPEMRRRDDVFLGRAKP